MASVRNRLTAWRACLRPAAWLLVFTGHGCATPPPVRPAAPALVRLEITNLTDYAWRVALRSRPGGTARETHVAPRETLTLEIAAGAYAIEQAIDGAASAPPGRTFTAEFAAGERYAWPLATVRWSGDRATDAPAEAAR